MEILQNTCLISAVLAWAVAQLCKLLIELIAHHRLDWERLTGDGGMPSGLHWQWLPCCNTVRLPFSLLSARCWPLL